ncbi:hypothetical protein RQN30_10220 [Arcanobacterium hippocoleae]
MNFFAQAMKLLSTGVIAGGSIWLIFGIIVLAGGLKEHNGQQTQSGIWQAIGGALITAAGVWLTQVNINF